MRSSAFQPHIQALRAVAVLLVVVYHFWPDRLPGGYIGVDVFFVISGYLITAHLMREVEQRGTISLPAFFARRARRLLPAALLVIAITGVAVFVLLPIVRVGHELWHGIASALYFENWALVADAADYLRADAAPNAFQHYWSLSVEEQFYVLWPLLILLAIVIARMLRRTTPKIITIVLAAVVAASFAYGIWLSVADPSLAYFSTLGRAWEFGAGALAALLPFALKARPGAALTWVGLAVLVACALLFGASTDFPGWAAVPVVLASLAVLVAGASTARWAPGIVMRAKPVQFIGDISYSLYLWHWPLILLVPVALGRDLEVWEKVVLLLAAVGLAAATRAIVEDPVRASGWLVRARPRRSLLLALGAMLATVALLGALTVAAQAKVAALVESGNSASLVPTPIEAGGDIVRNLDCWSTQDTTAVVPCQYGATDASALKVALVGDSHAEALSGAFIDLADQLGWNLTTYLRQACSWGEGPMLRSGSDFASKCTDYRVGLDEALVAGDFDAIVTTSAVYRKEPVGSADGFVKVWTPFVESGVKVIVIADNPRFSSDPVECLVSTADASDCDTQRKHGLRWPDPQLEAAARVPGVGVVDFTPMLCDADTCFATLDGFVVYRDNDHYTATFARSLEPELERQLGAAGLPK